MRADCGAAILPGMKTPSPALVVSLVALGVALGGTGYAVSQLPKNSVGTVQLKKNAVTGAKVKAGALTGAKIKDGSIELADLSPAARAGLAGSRGETGAQGEQGVQGQQGARGEAGPTASFAIDSPANVNLTGIDQQVIATTFVAPGSGRLLINASLDVMQMSAGAQHVSCVGIVMAADNISGFSSQRVYGYTSVAGEDVQLPVTFGGMLPAAGSYDVRIACSTSVDSGTPAPLFDRGDMTGVWTG